uniref:KANL2-like probable zinc-finger domain-containing protein n=1 Tax=Timema poppense TaxID=170557 RepID=A0A7R9GVN9_TIMPO|nr:unnamed protein product [Timema poppensis]
MELTRLVYYNGHTQLATSTLPKKESKTKKGKAVTKRDHFPSTSSAERRLKFSDKLKALLKTGTTNVNENGMDADDPYAFSEPEPQVLRLHQNSTPSNTYSRTRVALTSKSGQVPQKKNAKFLIHTSVDSNVRADSTVIHKMGLHPKPPAPTGVSITSKVGIISYLTGSNLLPSETKLSDDESSKTMNRLQAKIARNKVIGKHKKVRSGSRSPDFTPPTSSSSKVTAVSSLWPLHRERSLLEEQLLGLKQESVTVKKEPKSPPITMSPKSSRAARLASPPPATVLTLPPKRRRSRVAYRQTVASRHEALQRIQQLQAVQLDYKQDLFPLGLETSSSEEESDSEDVGTYQRHWFSSWTEPGMYVEGHRNGKLSVVRAELRRRLGQMCEGLVGQRECTWLGALLDTANAHPMQAALFLSQSIQQRRKGERNRLRPVSQNRSKSTLLHKKRCSYTSGEGCTNMALPSTQHCIQHVMYNVDQLLFEHCTAKFSDNTQCCVPVFDICHELPLCLEHARKRKMFNSAKERDESESEEQEKYQKRRKEMKDTLTRMKQGYQDNYDKMCAETKPKKVRRKAKPTRPSKRSKKKRRTQRLVETAPPTLSREHRNRVADNLERSEVLNGYIKGEEVDTKDDCVDLPLPATRVVRANPTEIIKVSEAAKSHALNTLESFHFRPVGPHSSQLKRPHQHLEASRPPSVLTRLAALESRRTSLLRAGDGLQMDPCDTVNLENVQPSFLQNVSAFSVESVHTHKEGVTPKGESLTEVQLAVKQIALPDDQYDVQEEVLGMTEGLPLDTVDLAQQATRLLEEHDLTNVLNQIPADAFNDLFTEDKNGQYVPTREETEELERALEAVDKDVKSLEKLSQTQGLLETLIDDPTLVQTLAQLPEVSSLSVSGGVYANYHHNGYVVANAAAHHDVMAALPQIKNFAQHSVVDLGPSISIQTQTDTMPS